MQIIKTLSVLINNITNKTIFYYLMSNNFINDIIINNYYIKHDNDYLLIYVNFLNILSSKLNQTTIQFLFREDINSFPLLENAIKLYNHPSTNIRNTIKKIFLIIIKIDYKPLNKYLCTLPIISYFCFLSCNIKDNIIFLSQEFESIKKKKYNYNDNNYNKYKLLLNDIIDNLIYIQKIFDIDYPKINYIITNCMFYYCIIPFILFNLNGTKKEIDEIDDINNFDNNHFNNNDNSNKKIKKSICIFFINLLLIYIKDETFINILYTLIFFPLITNSINKYIKNTPIQPDNYYYDWNQFNKKTSSSFLNYIQYNFNGLFLKSLIYNTNSKYMQVQQISMKYQKILNNDIYFDYNKNNDKYLKEIIKDVLNKLTCSEIAIMTSYHNYLSIGTGIDCGLSTKSTKYCIIEKMGKFFTKFFNNKNKMIKNNIKDNLFELLKKNRNKKDMNILLINLLLKNILNNNNISRILLKESNLMPGDLLKDEEISYIMNLNKEKSLLNINNTKKQNELINKANNIYYNNNFIIENNFSIEEANKENKNNLNLNDKYFETDIFKNAKISNMLISIDGIILNAKNITTQKVTKNLKNIDNNCDIDETINNKNKNDGFIIHNKSIEVILPKNKYSPFDKDYFNNIEKNKFLYFSVNNNKISYDNFYNEELVDIFIKLIDINSNIKIFTIKIIIDNILSLITTKKYNNFINNNLNNFINQCFISQKDKNKIFLIYEQYKNDILNNYNNKKSFHNNAYKMFIKQYDKYALLYNINNYDINEAIYLFLLPEDLQISHKDNKNINIIKNIEKQENKYERNIFLFLLIHDFYYKIISYEKFANNIIEREKMLYINSFPLIKRKTLELNKQYNLIDLDSNIKYYNCMCKIIKNNYNINESDNKNSDSDFFYSYLLIYDNFLYIGDSSNSTSYTIIKYKFLISSSTIKSENYNNKNITIYIMDDLSKQNYIEICLDFKNYNTSKAIKDLIGQEMKNSILFEKGKIKEFFESL